MAANINRVILAGNLGRDPEIKLFANQHAKASFSLAINRKLKDADGAAKEETTWVEVEAWGRTAELVGQYLTKGRACFIEGRLQLDQWEDKEGHKRSKLKVVADSVQFLDSAKDAGERQVESQPRATAARPARPAAPAPPLDDQPPF